MSKEKSRYFTFLMYPELLPDDWKDRLESLGVPIAVSPLHDKDKKDKSDDDEQEFKKAHYHGIYVANNPVTTDSVRKKLQNVLGDDGIIFPGIAKVQVIHKAVENVYLYLTHESKDAIAKGKHVYSKNEITHINSFDIDRYITLSVEDKEKIQSLLVEIIREIRCENLPDLFDYLLEKDGELGYPITEFTKVVKENTGYFRLWFDGNYQRRIRQSKKIENEYTKLKLENEKAMKERRLQRQSMEENMPEKIAIAERNRAELAKKRELRKRRGRK